MIRLQRTVGNKEVVRWLRECEASAVADARESKSRRNWIYGSVVALLLLAILAACLQR